LATVWLQCSVSLLRSAPGVNFVAEEYDTAVAVNLCTLTRLLGFQGYDQTSYHAILAS
jgi:hypothetical protein